MIDNLSIFFKKIDLYGIELQLRKDDLNKFHTIFGSIISLIIYISLIVLSVIFGKEIWERRLPRVTNGFEINSSNETDIYLARDYPFSYSLKNSITRKVLPYGEYYDLFIDVYDGTNLTAFRSYRLDPNKVVVPCSEFSFNEKFQELIKTDTLHLLDICFNFGDIFIRNDKATPNSVFAAITFSICDSSLRHCPDDLEQQTEQIFSHSLTVESFLNPKEKDNLISYGIYKLIQNLNVDTISASFLNISSNKLVIDQGWILEDTKILYHITTKISQETYLKSDLSKKYYQVIYFQTSSRINTSSVRYMKIQDLLANIGGLFNGLIIIGSIITTNYTYFLFYLNSYSSIIDFYHNNNVTKEHLFYSNLLKSKSTTVKTLNNISNVNLIKENQVNNNNNSNNNSKVFSQNNNILSINKLDKARDDKIVQNEVGNSNIQPIKRIVSGSLVNDNSNYDISKLNNNNSYDILKNANRKLIGIREKEINALQLNLDNHLKKIKENDVYEYTENYFKYLVLTCICCRSLNLKQRNISNYVLSYDRFVKHSMFRMALDEV